MSRISDIFVDKNHKALIAYITIGYPEIKSAAELITLLADNGCDIIELGIPFSDPLADGATIQKASYKALCNGVTPALCLQIAREAKKSVEKPLVFMTYYNPVSSYGLDKFCADCITSGIDGLIIPDLPAGESTELESITAKRGLDLIYLLAPNSDERRIKLVAAKSTGFIYLVSVTGITGARQQLPPGLDDFVSRVRKVAKQPLCVGFGISDPVQAAQIAGFADGVIIGSRIIQLIEEDVSLNKLKDFVKSLRTALDNI